MTALQVLTFFSAIFGAAGAVVLFFGSYALEPNAAFGFANPPEQARVDARNSRRVLVQRIGLGLILMAFVLQGVSAFAPG